MSLTFLVMQSLRGQLEVHLIHARSGLPVLLLDLYREVRAPELAHPAADAKLGTLGKNLPVPEYKDMSWTKCHANGAALAIALPHNVDVSLLGLISHTLLLKDIRGL
jgi:hypothetical protein